MIWHLFGVVTDAGGLAVEKVRVRVFDRDMRSEQLLGEAFTDAEGRYAVEYSAEQFALSEKKSADLVVRVLDANNGVIAESKTVFNAASKETIDIRLSLEQYRGPSEYERYRAELEPLTGKVPLADLTSQDVSFLTQETGIAADRLGFLQLDAFWSQTRQVPQAVFYGLLRQGLPAVYRRLLAEKPSRLKAALEASLERNIIPQALGKMLEDILERLSQLAIEAASEQEDEREPAPPGKLLATSELDPELQDGLVAFALRYEGETTKFWEAAKKEVGLDDAALGEARFAMEAGALVSRHLPTLEAVQKIKREKGWADTRGLAQLSRGDWHGVVEGSTVKGVPAGFKDPKQYAEAIALGIERALPTAVFAHNVASSELGNQDIDTFFGQNDDFDLVHTRVDEYFQNGVNLKGIEDPDRLRAAVKGFQRIVRVVPRQQFFATTEALVKAGYQSAISIHAKGERRFVEENGKTIEAAVLRDVYAKSGVVANVSGIAVQRLRDSLGARGPVFPGLYTDSDPEPGEIPEWAKLFGNVSGCACVHCRSVYGPAAYLADLLKFVDDAPSSAVYDLLSARRPDIEHLLLDCDNANTPLPHIDIVNEILGDAVAGVGPVARQTEGTAESLRARPAPGTENGAASGIVAAATFPWALPFDRHHEEAQLFADHLGLDIAALWKTFGRAAPELTRAELGFNETEWSLLTVAPADDAVRAAQWGVTSLADLRNVTTFLEKSGLSYPELEALCESTFLSAGGAGEVTLDRGADPCDISDDTLNGIIGPNPVLDQVHRFVRLSRHLGWPIEEGNTPLDTVLAALDCTAIDADALATLSRARRLAAIARRPVSEFLQLDVAGLARALRTTTDELILFAQLLGADPSRPRDVLDVVDHWAALRDSGLDARELAYVLVGWDQEPAAFTPRADQVDGFLDGLHALVEPMAATTGDAELDRMLADNLARFVDADSELTAALLGVLHAPANPSALAIAELRAWARAGDGAGRDGVRQIVLGVHRIATLASRMGLGARELLAVAGTRIANGFVDLEAIARPPAEPALSDPDAAVKLAGLRALWEAVRLRDELPRGDRDLFDHLTDTALDSATLARFTGWPSADIDSVVGAAPDFSLVETYARLHRVMAWAHRFSVDGTTLQTWASASPEDLASALRGTARARCADDASWHAVQTPISDILREKTRDALLAYLIHSPASPGSFEDASEVYAHYLIDVEMSSCQLTSRIVQATAGIQLLIQRLLMNLEPVRLTEADADHWTQWEWRKNYRVWEANRKVFLYPENWLEPELRDDKTPFFRELENELLQDEISDETAERAYRRYLSKLDDVANLDVRGLYYDEDADVLHVVARTHASPHVHYYRKRIGREWTPWQPVDMNIESDHLLPVVHEGRLFLFWALFEEDGRPADPDADDEGSWRITMAWSEYRDGRWQARQLGDDLPVLAARTSKDDYCFKAYVEEGSIYIRIFVRHEDVNDLIGSIMRLRFDACARTLVNDRAPERNMVLPPAGTRLSGMEFIEDPETSADELSTTLSLGDDTLGLAEEIRELLEEGGLGGVIVALFLAILDVHGQWERLLGSRERTPLLDVTPGTFSILPTHQYEQLAESTRFCAKVDGRTYLVTPERIPVFIPATFSTSGAVFMNGGAFEAYYTNYRFEALDHPYMCEMIRVAEREGTERVMLGSEDRPTEWAPRQRSRSSTRFRALGPKPHVARPYPMEEVSFALDDANGLYNWELFFHIPLLVATRLSDSQRFEEAQKWFHYIFDPTDVSDALAPAKYWKVKPLYEEALEPPETIRALMQRLADGLGEDVEAQIEAWERDPFDPHAIARLRRLAYMRGVVMKYVDNLIAWGDSLYQRNTRESVNEAAQLYVLASEILGQPGTTVDRPEAGARDYASLRDDLGELANAFVELESALPGDLPGEGGIDGTVPAGVALYFCIPGNQKLEDLRATVGDRLFKIRHCMTIDGERQSLPLFAPPIDPALLVRARAMGLDLREVLAQVSAAALPGYRYPVVYQKALELVGDVRALGNALLAALEKKDGEDLALLRARHEGAMLDRIRGIKVQHVKEAEEALDGLAYAKASAENRYEYYSSKEFMNAAEISQLTNLSIAQVLQSIGEGFNTAAAVAHMFPDVTAGLCAGTTHGGSNVGNSLRATAGVFNLIASQHSFAANLSSIIGGYQRRQDDWVFQAEQAAIEIRQIETQILAAEIRLAIAESELDSHDARIEQAQETEAFLRRKFTSAELFGWMSSQLAALHHEAYRMAYDVATKAEAAAAHHLGVEAGDFSFITFGHWDSQKKGLLAGERLHQELRRMDVAFMERNEREEEVTRHISLRSLDPRKLVELRETGRCTFSVPEMLFDLDFPGHYGRRIKSVSLTLPCVAGPYTSISARLALDSSTIRALDGTMRPGTHVGKSIATSSAQNDSGVFELNFRDERWLPFEGAGAISTWTLELTAPAALRPFDYDTISDVVLHMKYTAAYDGTVRTRVEGAIEDAINDWLGSDAGFYRLLSLREERPSELHQFLHPPAGATHHQVSIPIGDRDFPHLLRHRIGTATVEELVVIVKPSAEAFPPGSEPSPFEDVSLEAGRGPLPPTPGEGETLAAAASWGGLPVVTVPKADVTGVPTGEWGLRLDPAALPSELRVEEDGQLRLRPEALEDILVAVRYRVPTLA